MRYTDDQIAQVVHEANRALQRIQGDPAVSPPWDQAPEWQRQSALAGVHQALNGASPRQLHEGWVEYKLNEGWQYGEVKNEHLRRHPCLVDYDELPPEQKLKDRLFMAIVEALSH